MIAKEFIEDSKNITIVQHLLFRVQIIFAIETLLTRLVWFFFGDTLSKFEYFAATS